MPNYFFLDGESSLWYGLTITQQAAYNAPQPNIEKISVPGRDGDLLIDMGGYANVPVTYSVWMKHNLPERTRVLKAWLFKERGYRRLEDTYDMAYFRKARFTGPIDWETAVLSRAASTTIEFDCAPYRYLKAGENTIKRAKPGVLYNPEGFPSLPYFKIYGTGAGQLYIGNRTISVTNIDGYLEVDCETMNAFKGTQNKNSTVILPDNLSLQPGDNLIQWGGGINRLEIIPRWRTL